MNNEKVYAMPFTKLYAALLNKVTRKQRSEDELITVISWMTGYRKEDILYAKESDISYGDFFRNAPAMNPSRFLIKGKVCGVDPATIADPLMKDMRYLDKLVDDLAKGKKIEKILPKNEE